MHACAFSLVNSYFIHILGLLFFTLHYIVRFCFCHLEIIVSYFPNIVIAILLVISFIIDLDSEDDVNHQND